jgi:hypothetical protein
MPQAEYLLGHSEREIQRLIHQAAILRPITERLFREIALRPGIGALDAPFLSLGVCGKLRKDARTGGPVAKT